MIGIWRTVERSRMRGMFFAWEPASFVIQLEYGGFEGETRLTAHVYRIDLVAFGIHLVDNVPRLQRNSLGISVSHWLRPHRERHPPRASH